MTSRTYVRSKRERIAAHIVAFLRRKYPAHMHECVSRDTGISVYAIQKLEHRLSAPSLAAFDALVEAYGLEFLAFVFEWEWLEPVQRASKDAALKARVSALKARVKNAG